jgi:hypothetical protein
MRPSGPAPQGVWAVLAILGASSSACKNIPPPASVVPNADAALARLRATGECGRAVMATAKIDHFGNEGRVRGELQMFAAAPAQLRMDVESSFGFVIATLTSDGTRFALRDLREKRFFTGPATTCNIQRLTQVPIPGFALVDLLRGQAPVLKHTPQSGQIVWNTGGYYIVSLASTRDAGEELHIAPHPSDFGRPWTEQRMRLLEVVVRQYGGIRYRAELDDHHPAAMAKERVDPDGIDPPIPPSGPVCSAEIPWKIHMSVPDEHEDVLFAYTDVTWNPPLPRGTFQQALPTDMEVVPVRCE